MTPVLPIEETVEEAKCEDLEKIFVGDDLKKFFQVRVQLRPKKRKRW